MNRSSSGQGGHGLAAEVVVARGKIKVDAQKALHKLRDHMLVDHHLWACEIARVAVALGAPVLSIDYDTDDLVLSFGGSKLLSTEAIARARDHVLTPPPEGDDEGDAMRLLGIGVSAALALDPSFVDVYRAIDNDCERIRFESHHLDAEDEVADATPKPQRVPRPPDLKSAGAMMRVHLKRKLGFDLLGRAIKGDVPREIALLIDAARDAPLEIVVRGGGGGGGSIKRQPPPPAILRVDLDEPAVTRGSLEILQYKAHTRADSCVVFLERGIRLVRYALNVGLFQPMEEGALPVRVVIDAKRLPTNASRSELRMDTDLLKRLLARIEPSFVIALDTLEAAAGWRKTGPSPEQPVPQIGHAPEMLTRDPVQITEALGDIVAEVAKTARYHRSEVGLADRAKALLTLPVLMDAMGQPLSYSQLKGGSGALPLYIYQGRAPAPRELALWLSGIVWRRGVAAERGFADWLLAPADDLALRAYEAYGRRARALQHAPSPPALPASPTHLLRQRFEVKQGPFVGLNGEVALLKSGSEFRRSSTVRLFVDDRLLETTQLPGVGLSVEIALAWPGQIVATFDYHAVERTEALSRAILYALRLAATAAGERLTKEADPELTRLAVAAWCAATSTLLDAEMKASSLGRLAYAHAWSTTDGRHVSLFDIEDYVKRTNALCVASSAARGGAAPDGRPVILDSQVHVLKPFLQAGGGGSSIVRYDAALSQPPDASAQKLAMETNGLPAIAIHQGNIEGFLAVWTSSAIGRRRTYHAGFLLKDEVYHPRGAPVLLVIDDRAAVPNEKLDGLLWSSILVGLGREEDALTEVVVERCERGEIDFESVKGWVANAEERLRSKTPRLADRLGALPKKVEHVQRMARKAALLSEPKVDFEEGIFQKSPAVVSKARGRIGSPVGEVIVALAKEQLRAEVLFEGRRIGTANNLASASLPVIAIVDMRREDQIASDWRALNEKGERWARSAIVEASLLLLGELVKDEQFVRTSLALDLVLALHASAPQRVARLLTAVAWPTVQGGKMWLPEEPSTVSYGSIAYSPYRSCGENEEPSPFDGPAIFMRKDWLTDLWMRVLEAVGHKLVDVTDPIARLQSRRARGLPTAPPKLGGEPPAHAFLRASLTSLGQTIVEGEIELVEGEHSDVTCVAEDGTTVPFDWPDGSYVPARIVFRPDPSARHDEIQVALAQSIDRLVMRLVEKMDEAPFLKKRLRFLTCQTLMRGERPVQLETLWLFPTLDGSFLSLEGLVASREIHVSFDPPWEELGFERTSPILYLTESEAQALSTVTSVLDVTDGLRLEKQGIERRKAAAVSSIALAPEVRAQCLATFPISHEEGIAGEIGLLLPSHAYERHVDLFTTMRPLCRIPDPDGWPMVAVINDDAIVANVGFDGIAPDNMNKSIGRIHLAMKIATGRQMPTILDAPRNAAGVIRLPTPFVITNPTDLGRERPVSAIGVFWMTREWPEIPELRVETIGAVDPFRTPAIRDFAIQDKKAHHGLLPLAGRVYIAAPAGSLAAETALQNVLLWLRQRLPTIVRSWSRSTQTKKEHQAQIEAYEWDLALLGIYEGEPPREPLKELALDRPSDVLVKVATRRAPHLMIKTEADHQPLPPFQAPSPLTQTSQAVVEAHHPTEPEIPTNRPSFLGGLVRKVVGLFSEEQITTTDSALARSLGAALAAMKLTGDPVTSVVEATSGRPVRYEKSKKRIVINTAHASIEKLMSKKSCVLVLLASAVSEVNRELEQVTDAEELAILLDLLRANES